MPVFSRIDEPVGAGVSSAPRHRPILNAPGDVQNIQELLNKIDPADGGPQQKLQLTGKINPALGGNDPTVKAIRAFQRRQFGFEDGVVDPRNKTENRIHEIIEKPDDPPGPGPNPPQPKPGASRNVRFRPPLPNMRIKFAAHDPGRQDLEDQPVDRPAAATAKVLALSTRPPLPTPLLPLPSFNPFSPPTPTISECEANLLTFIGVGGPGPKELAQFLFRNQTRNFERVFANGTFFSNEVRKDTSSVNKLSFTAKHAELADGIQQALQKLASDNRPSRESDPVVVDVSKLADGPDQPEPLRKLATGSMSFSHKQDPTRLAGNPLAFGIGAIQGIDVQISRFFGKNDGTYSGALTYSLFDHFGSNDDDLIDPGQGSLWLMQRGMCDGEDATTHKPYIIKIVVEDVLFDGRIV